MRRLLCEHALINGVWQRQVAIDVAPDGSIAAVEPAAAHEEGERLGGFVLPGLIDAHCHVAERLLAGLLPEAGSDHSRRARQLRERLLARLGPEELWAVAAALFVELLASGCTSVVVFHDLHHGPDGTPYDDAGVLAVALHEAAREAGIGLTLLVAGRQVGGWDGSPLAGPHRRSFLTPDGVLRLLERVQQLFGDDPGRRLGLGIPALGAVLLDRLDELVTALAALDPHAPVQVQLAAEATDLRLCRAVHGSGPLTLLAQRMTLDARWCLAHAIGLDAGERARLLRLDAVIALTPTCEVRGIAEVAELVQRLPRIASGSDAAAVTDAAIRLQALLRLLRAGAPACGIQDGLGLLARVLAGGAQASGRAVGRLAPGFRADLVHLDPQHPLFAAASPEQVVDIWLSATSRRPFVRDVLVGGIWQVRDGQHVAMERAFESYRQVRSRILGDLP
jgi:formimidoylglutamate deiminase